VFKKPNWLDNYVFLYGYYVINTRFFKLLFAANTPDFLMNH